MKFDLTDISVSDEPIYLTIKENGKPIELELNRFTIMSRIWAKKQFGSIEKWWQELFPNEKNFDEETYYKAVIKTVHHLLKDKSRFKTWEDLANKIGFDVRVIQQLIKLIIYVVSNSEKAVEQADEAIKKKIQELNSMNQETMTNT